MQDRKFSNTKLGDIFGKNSKTLYTFVMLEIKRVDKRVTEITVHFNIAELDEELVLVDTFTPQENKDDFKFLVEGLKLEKK